MLVLNSIFSNYLEFAELFGTKQSRVNKIPLAALKSKSFFNKMKVAYGYSPLLCTPKKVFDAVMRMLETWDDHVEYSGLLYSVKIIDRYFIVPLEWQFPTLGLSENENPSFVYYEEEVWTKKKNGYEYKKREVKAGRFMKSLIEISDLVLTDEVINFVCEEFTNKWKAYVSSITKGLTLYVGSTESAFKMAYDSSKYKNGTFNSCMENRGYHTFYTDAVRASVAILFNDEEEIVARCVIFDEVRDDRTGEIFRLAERQYACDDIYKRILIIKLIQDGRIDGYKDYGTGSGDVHNFVPVTGGDLCSRNLSIECNLKPGDPLSYQDSFFGYDCYAHRACNYQSNDFDLATCDGYVGKWDEYHQEYVQDVVTVYVDGREMSCDADDLRDFKTAWNGNETEWHHEDDVVFSKYYNAYIVAKNAVELYNGDWALRRDAFKLYDGRFALESDSVKLYDGRFALESDSVFNNDDGKWYLNEEE